MIKKKFLKRKLQSIIFIM